METQSFTGKNNEGSFTRTSLMGSRDRRVLADSKRICPAAFAPPDVVVVVVVVDTAVLEEAASRTLLAIEDVNERFMIPD